MQRTRTEFIEAFKHDLAGMLIEALTTKGPDCPLTSAQLGVKAMGLIAKSETRLGQMYDYLAPPPKSEPPQPIQPKAEVKPPQVKPQERKP